VAVGVGVAVAVAVGVAVEVVVGERVMVGEGVLVEVAVGVGGTAVAKTATGLETGSARPQAIGKSSQRKINPLCQMEAIGCGQ